MTSITDKVVVRQMHPSDVETVMQIKNAENWNQTEKDWLFLMSHSPNSCLVACVDSTVVGTVTGLNYGNQLAWVGMMLVSKEFRGLGVSKMLLNTLIEKLKDCKSLKLDAVPSGVPIYKKLGFVEEYEICRMTTVDMKHINTDFYHGDHLRKKKTKAVMTMLPITESSLVKVSQIDEELYGVNRMDLFKFLLKEQRSSCWEIREDDFVKGYVFGRKGSKYLQVGPVLAQGEHNVKNLLMQVFKSFVGRPLVVDVLMRKKEIIDWLVSLGFEDQRRFVRMYLNSNNRPGNLDNQYLISGPELG